MTCVFEQESTVRKQITASEQPVHNADVTKWSPEKDFRSVQVSKPYGFLNVLNIKLFHQSLQCLKQQNKNQISFMYVLPCYAFMCLVSNNLLKMQIMNLTHAFASIL